ncbi:MAG: hypothetical protein QF732_08025 [Nitrospinaceae bacterium]|nr:hypothetical protein [Nitrospinaceae bacterium]
MTTGIYNSLFEAFGTDIHLMGPTFLEDDADSEGRVCTRSDVTSSAKTLPGPERQDIVIRWRLADDLYENA